MAPSNAYFHAPIELVKTKVMRETPTLVTRLSDPAPTNAPTKKSRDD